MVFGIGSTPNTMYCLLEACNGTAEGTDPARISSYVILELLWRLRAACKAPFGVPLGAPAAVAPGGPRLIEIPQG